MKRESTALVTGAAGFIGSCLSERLIQDYNVIGIDCFTNYYPLSFKESNLAKLIADKNFRLIKDDLLRADLSKMDVDFVFHEAAQGGVRASWGDEFRTYVLNNVLATQRLLEASLDSDIKKFVYASSSSVYGDVNNLPIREDSVTRPMSPYGVTKLAAENLCYLYWKNYGLPTVSLRYFTVYGPRQRPDMAISKFIGALLHDTEITIYGDGNQTRSLTYISDVVEANLLATKDGIEGEIFNIAGDRSISLNEIISHLEKIIGKKAKKRFVEEQKGDVEHTWASVEKAKKILGYTPKVAIEEGLERQVKWRLEVGF